MIRYSLFTHKGARKTRTDDAVFATGKAIQSPDRVLAGETAATNTAFAVFDGVGGSQNGALASRTCANAFGDLFVSSEITSVSDVRNALEMLQALVMEARKENDCTAQTTVVAVLLQKSDIWILNVGDSPLLLEAGEYFEQITELDTYINQLLKEKGFVTEEEERAYVHRLSHVLGYNGFDKYRAHVYHLPRKTGLRFFLMSDGVANYFSKGNIEALSRKEHDLVSLTTFVRSEILRLGAEDDFSLIGVEIIE